MKLDLAFVPPVRASGLVIVIDVLRMTTTAAALFSRHLDELAVVADTGKALELARNTGALLLGERGGVPVRGFAGGNSPVEQLSGNFSGKMAILCTTNGSRAVEAAQGARHVLLGAIVNARAVAERALELAPEEITLLCAGTLGETSLDDVLGAGCIADELLRLDRSVIPTDAVRIALRLAESTGGVSASLREAAHARILSDLGFDADVEFAGRRNELGVAPEQFADSPLRFSARGPAGAGLRGPTLP